MPDTVVVFAGGAPPGSRALAAVPPGATIVGADRGAEHALDCGLHVDAAVGDFDSISPAALEALAHAGVRIVRHPVAKDATDLELALDEAMALAPRRILLVGGVAGRFDHLLGELSLLASDAYAAVELDAVLGDAVIDVVRRERTLVDDIGALISLLPLHGPAVEVTTSGLAYPLNGETLTPGSSRGSSNVFAEREARVSVERGVLLAVRPGESTI